MSNIQNAAKAYSEFLRALGLTGENARIDIEDSALNTAQLMSSWMSGIASERPVLSRMPAPDQELVSINELPFYSFCGHHFVPFFGTVSISYCPERWIAGLGGFCRIIDHWARRPQFQENLCSQIAEHIQADLSPRVVRVQLQARQMCLELHGKGAGIIVETTKVIGDRALLK